MRVGEIIKRFREQVRSVDTIYICLFFSERRKEEVGTMANYKNFPMIPVKQTLKKTVNLNINNFLCGYL